VLQQLHELAEEQGRKEDHQRTSMSLFGSREWWAARLGDGDEEFDQGSLCIANIDNAQNGAGM